MLSFVERTERVSRAAARDARGMGRARVFSVGSRLTGAAEVAVILGFLGHHPGVLVALLCQATGQVVGWTTSFVPLQVGTAEGGAHLLFKGLGLPPVLGVTLELARKARRLVFAAAGIALLGADAAGDLLRWRFRPPAPSTTGDSVRRPSEESAR